MHRIRMYSLKKRNENMRYEINLSWSNEIPLGARRKTERKEEKDAMPRTLFQMTHPLESVFEVNFFLCLQWPVFDDCRSISTRTNI